MKPADKHFKFINSKTGYVIYYHSISSERPDQEIKAELQKVKTRVAIQNGIYLETVYWEEMRENAEL
ncbi:hypothetical protein [Mucilaginibacter sp. SP1R1]|uniref:hypothetical protein n=1 Tax=Mucilaginibacter sp. SP1R1 TaxID=2723091 RepID=UPI0016214049|nr:hypothetical protein [Mucilaginibacter sp. SP1R1]MBB6147920.1 hypothetical protein [Mucilaginibacter sp. SP1R1]